MQKAAIVLEETPQGTVSVSYEFNPSIADDTQSPVLNVVKKIDEFISEQEIASEAAEKEYQGGTRRPSGFIGT